MDDIMKQVDEWVGSDPDNYGRVLSALEDAAYATAEHWVRIAKATAKAREQLSHKPPY